MNFLRRLYVFLLSLLLIIVVTILLLAPGSVIGWLGSIAELSPILRVVAAVVINGLLVLLAFMQFRSAKPTTTGLMMRGTGAIAEVSVESARDRILKAVSDVSDVVSAEATVKPIRGRADVELQVEVLGDDLRLPRKQQEIDRALKQVINKQLGLQLAGRPRVHIQLYGQKAVKPAPVIPAPVVAPPVLAPVVPVVVEPKLEPVPVVVEKPLTPVDPLPPVRETIPPPIEKPPVEEKPSTGFFTGLFGRSDEPEKVIDEPLPPPVVVEEEKPETSLFGSWRRVPLDDEPAKIDEPVSLIDDLDDELPDDDAATIKLDMSKETAGLSDDEWDEPFTSSASSDDSLLGDEVDSEEDDKPKVPPSL